MTNSLQQLRSPYVNKLIFLCRAPPVIIHFEAVPSHTNTRRSVFFVGALRHKILSAVYRPVGHFLSFSGPAFRLPRRARGWLAREAQLVGVKWPVAPSRPFLSPTEALSEKPRPQKPARV